MSPPTEGEVCKVSKLPDDIFFDIISRLPLKTISACKWVSKTWYALILNPRLAEIHFAKTNSPCVLFGGWYKKFHLIDNECFDSFDTSATTYHIEFKEFNENFTMDGSINYYEVVGLVNGLVCFCHESHEGCFNGSPYYVCNPITKDYVIPPKSPNNHIEPLGSGFGFD
ncbi:hypothetical protein IFM89_011319 [Coptis chinensis]|uniref:F-box domain-containing protein n=1 Tax=Coptis chinensis TaxID=261450 RepID=A0A835IVE4_9MAGN|nr:hypothetical protein IFM89_011319 [Coptis chinensis]